VLACSPYVVPPPVPRMITFRQGEGLQFQLRQDTRNPGDIKDILTRHAKTS
jgi:hypothetical protein